MSSLSFLAFDLGASSGRGILGRFDGSILKIEEIHRFPNEPVAMAGHLYWDFPRLYREVLAGMRAASGLAGSDGIAALGMDTWGVDYGLLDAQGELIGNPYHYRDARTDGMFEEVFKRIDRSSLYRETGTAFMRFNTIFQLMDTVIRKPRMLEEATDFLFTPDLFAKFLTGRKVAEYSIASTSQLMEAARPVWSGKVMDAIGIPVRLFPEIVQAGTVVGPLLGSVREETGLGAVPFVAVAAHDTGSAVAAVPGKPGEVAFISSGTWSLMGFESPTPLITDDSFAWGYTNEGGAWGGKRVLKNIMGLWIIQECKRVWDAKNEKHSFGELADMADRAPAFRSLIDPDDERFFPTCDMPSRIRDFCRETGQSVPEDAGSMARCIFESLALKYRFALEQLEAIAGKRFSALHVVGGGSKNTVLNRYTANAIGRPVIAGPGEATAIGNLIVQAIALGAVAGPDEARDLVIRSFPTETLVPDAGLASAWNDAYGRFRTLAKT
jgi:rhamnulokinase